MSDVECPYCGAEQEINHDDGYGYAESKTYEQECVECEKIFAFNTSIYFSYTAHKADCLNGGEHKYEKVYTSSREHQIMNCVDCGKEKILTIKLINKD